MKCIPSGKSGATTGRALSSSRRRGDARRFTGWNRAPVGLVPSRYARTTGYPIQYQWTLLEGVNDSDAEAERIAALLAGKYAMMNFIAFNRIESGTESGIDGAGFSRVSTERAAALVLALRQHGIVACLRDSAGQAVDGGCGQLRARTLDGTPAVRRVLRAD